MPTDLRPHETVNLQLTCRCFLHLCRDPGQWRLRCFEDSSFLDDIKRRQTQALVLYGQAPRQQQQEPPPSPPPTPPPPLSLAATSGRRERARILANWDPSYEGERVSWYDEYIHRYGPISVNWFQVPNDRASWDPRRYVDVRGVALYRPDGPDGRLLAVCPLDDGSVCLWNVKGSGARKGEIVQRSDEAILFAHGPDVDNTARLRRVDSGVTECISVDSKRHRAYVAVQSRKCDAESIAQWRSGISANITVNRPYGGGPATTEGRRLRGLPVVYHGAI